MTTLVFEQVDNGASHVVEVRRLLVAGFTGRDEEAVAEHIAELADMGVPVPETTPTLYQLDPALIRQSEVLVVQGANTSGEVEPVVVVSGDRRLLTVGSDHTDRDLEREDIAASKAAAPKAVGTSCVLLDDVGDWDSIGLRSTIDGDVLYQSGSLGSLLPLDSILARLADDEGIELTNGDVLFLGTVAAKGGIRPSATFAASLDLPDERSLSLSYRVVDTASTGRPAQRKPEIEFAPVDEVPWTPVEGGVPGQTERILAMDRSSGLATRMLRFEPGTDTTELGVLRHDFWEEVYILEGELHDLTLGETFPAGTYASRPPGMPHGPWRSEAGCVTFEVRYPAI